MRYDPIIKEISDGLQDRGVHYFWDLPEGEKPPGLSVTIETVDDLKHFPDCIDSLVSLAPGFLFRALNATARQRRDMVLINSSFSLRTWIGTAVGMPRNEKLPLIFPADRYNVQTFEELWALTTPNDGPNPAWKKSVLEDHRQGASFEAAFVACEMLNHRKAEWGWGYALWDDQRLEQWKAALFDKTDDTSVN